ncbi:MAG: aminotransferase class III-fold pyridoxal phosphate-dependent enzyme [Bacillota bacterium]
MAPTAKDKTALLGLSGALSLDRSTTGDLFAKYVNPGLKMLLSAVGFDKKFARADGVSVFDDSGKKYLDFLGGYGSLPFGHNPKDILAAVDRVNDSPNFLQAQASPFQAALAHDLAQISPGDLEITFFSNSGTEAVESALKLARGAQGEGVFIHCTGAFHGKTLGSLSVGGREKYKKPFLPLLPGTVEIPFGDADALEKALREHKVAAFIVEPIQGEGGVMVFPDGYMRKVRELTERYGAILILDEVQTGFGRTGKMFACEHEGIAPDILCLAKALGGGVAPIGATIATKRVWEKAYGGLSRAVLHTSTFGGAEPGLAPRRSPQSRR